MATPDEGDERAQVPLPMLTVAAVARRLGVAPSTLRTWDRRYNLGPSAHTAGAHRRYGPADVARLVVMRRLTLEGVPPAEIGDAVGATVEEVRARFGLDEPIVRLHKLGPKLYVEVDFVVEAGEWDVSEEDAVRRAVVEGLAPLGLDVWAYVELTTDRALVE